MDESAVRSDHRRGTTWGAVGQTPVVQGNGDRFGMKLISAVSPRGEMRFAKIEGRMNSTRFLSFVRKLRSDAGGPIIVIADNAAYHTSGKTRRFAAQNRGEVTFACVPRYPPERNPDELVCNHAKARLSKLFVDSKETMKRSVRSILRSIQSQGDLIRSFFEMESTRYAAL